MSDLFVFFIGCVVTVMVASAVLLLLWGAANEPRDRLVPSERASGTKEPRASERRVSSPGGPGSKHPVG